MKALLLCLLLLIPSVSFAAYQNPIVESNVRQSNGFPLITFRFVGNAGEPVAFRSYSVGSATTATVLRNWINDTINELDLMHTAAALAILQPGQTVPRLARVVPPPTAKEIWNEKARRYERYRDLGVTSAAFTTDLNALKADLDATYQDGFID